MTMYFYSDYIENVLYFIVFFPHISIVIFLYIFDMREN